MICKKHNKIGYKTQLDAMFALSECKRELKLKSNFNRMENRIYFDGKCKFWHLTSHPINKKGQIDNEN